MRVASFLCPLIAGALAIIPVIGQGADDASAPWTLSTTTGITYSSGKYGTEDTTDIWVVPVIVKAQKGRFSSNLVLPYIRTNGVAVIRDIGPVVTATSRTVHGWGDVTASVGYDFYVNDERLENLSFSGKIKFPTGDKTKGLGTGEYDYAVQVDGFKGIGNVALVGTLAYRIYGDLPDVPLRNVFYGSVGAFYSLSPAHTIGVSYETREAIRADTAIARDATLFYSYKATETSQVLLFVGKGFSTASQDYGGGLLVVYRF